MRKLFNYTLLITVDPLQRNADTPLRFASALLKQKHTIESVFFSHDASLIAASNIADKGRQLAKKWLKLALEYHFPLRVCSKAAIERGIEPDNHNWDSGFAVSGLSELALSSLSSTRFIHFG